MTEADRTKRRREEAKERYMLRQNSQRREAEALELIADTVIDIQDILSDIRAALRNRQDTK